ncbi:hypothetical protein Dsin_022030 [Dipteronia sinensis]|uniref:Reverse transcriptase zinc-binding domain-containing protein n=1 Tax=Dipteronia sinensis TaxID=43782 RepID=A0AAE0A0R7_9ROSI|nr:hypothetical protein Dsin_022030 [Dipteronia sinensis]
MVYLPKVHKDVNLVCHLKTPSGCWDGLQIQKLLIDSDSVDIVSISVSNVQREDSLSWHFSSNGNYTVRSGYKLGVDLLQQHLSSSSGSVGAGSSWNDLWKIDVPPKIKGFIWKACKIWIQTLRNRFRRKIAGDGYCPLCYCCHETTTHAL